MINKNTCSYFALAVIFVYGVIGVRLGYILMRHAKGGPPMWFDAFRKRSYTAEGQKWLVRVHLWVAGVPVVFLAILSVAALLCR